MKKFKKLLVTLGAFGGLALAGTAVSANSVYTVKSGDTLSEIATNYHTDVNTLAELNKIQDINVISVGEELQIPDETVGATQASQPVQQATSVQPSQVAQTTPVQTEQAQATPVTNSGDNSNKALRRQIESGGNYNTNTGNGYLGAYQFAPSTIASIESATGMKWSMNPATQDAFADYYANQRYGGWQNVPTTGGW